MTSVCISCLCSISSALAEDAVHSLGRASFFVRVFHFFQFAFKIFESTFMPFSKAFQFFGNLLKIFSSFFQFTFYIIKSLSWLLIAFRLWISFLALEGYAFSFSMNPYLRVAAVEAMRSDREAGREKLSNRTNIVIHYNYCSTIPFFISVSI